MIQNIVILLLANTIIPMLPVPPAIFAPLPLVEIGYHETSVFEHMNLSRIHTEEQFKKSFRESLKILHPDRGGNQNDFSRVKNLKKIMETSSTAYDTLNVTEIDLDYGVKLEQAVKIKETAYYVETAIFYFVILLYGLAFTIQEEVRPARKYIILCIFLFGAYEFYIHTYPQYLTLFDLINNKLPIFQQKKILKHLLSCLVAVFRTFFMRKQTDEKKLMKQLEEPKEPEEYKKILTELLAIYKLKVQAKLKNQNSWSTKLRKLVSALFTLLILYSVITGFFGGGQSNQEQGL